MILADTGFFVAIASPNDQFHHAAIAALEAIDEPIVTTYPVITETCYLLLRETGSNTPPRFLRNFIENEDLLIFSLETVRLQRIVDLMETMQIYQWTSPMPLWLFWQNTMKKGEF